MSRRGLFPLGVAVVALLAVVGVAAHAKPLSSGGGGSSGGPTTTFWSYTYTTLLIVALLVFIGVIWVSWLIRPDVGPRKSTPGGTLRALVILVAFLAVGFYVRFHFLNAPKAQKTNVPHQATTPDSQQGASFPRRHAKQVAHFQWDELIVVLALLTAVGAVYVVRRKRLGPGARRQRLGATPETLAAALDESLDDLRSDPDLRRAIVAAYARMEKALAAAGVPRRPAEAPLEYLERSLLSLETSADAVCRLTDLFQWAKFSHHAPEPEMRDEAVDALVAVRDELRASGRVAV